MASKETKLIEFTLKNQKLTCLSLTKVSNWQDFVVLGCQSWRRQNKDQFEEQIKIVGIM